VDKSKEKIIDIILKHYRNVQAIYLFGSFGTNEEWPNSDVDIALLFTHTIAGRNVPLINSECLLELESELNKKVDLLNIKTVSTVFQKEIIFANRRIYCNDSYAAQEFEMLTLSYYQELNWERKEILNDFYKSKRAYNV